MLLDVVRFNPGEARDVDSESSYLEIVSSGALRLRVAGA